MSAPERKNDGPEKHGATEGIDLGGVVDVREKIGGIGPRVPIPGPVAEPFTRPPVRKIPFTIAQRPGGQGNTPSGN